ncbi:aldehyde dehydrogenase [Paenibacillus cremeus]|uniref:Aldehyde dehydrogenase n=1 Tax=Paenibacillus cremeus TaxID=2163881 RepID=A0A559JZU7_9BACL|nr:aldehyde dehydrogenase [Paenibacillus cremeus]TVY05377.1 aldehyde dehydrogenase [Paenibacillus cremeus]
MSTHAALIHKQTTYFRSRETLPLAFRKQALKRLADAIRAYESDIIQALKQDLNKSEFEAYSSEVGIVLKEIRFMLQHLSKWARPRKVRTPMTHIGSSGKLLYEPYGVALIIAPWNFPFQLAVLPLIGAIAAGNCAIVKPSELTPNTAEVLAWLIGETFLEEYITVVLGGVETSQSLLAEKVDKIFYTGGTEVGKVVMKAAAMHLTPVTLELGGKSPCIVHKDARLKLAAKRIAWGKFMNAGQTCVAPDYVYVHEDVKEEFLTELMQATALLYGADPLADDTYTRVISAKHFDRLQRLMPGGEVVFGGKSDRDSLRMEPTVLVHADMGHSLMQEEIFGPLLPVLTYTDIEQVLQFVNSRPKPLALYLFSESERLQRHVLEHASFGGGCVNDTVYHYTSPYLPFGGVGSSGMGAYHGESSFQCFSHRKSVLKQTTLLDIPFRYPHLKNGLKRIKMFLK